MNEHTLKTEKHMYAYIHTYKYTYINSCVQPMAYSQWDMTASSGNWWYPWTAVCGFSGVPNPIFLFLSHPPSAVLLTAEHLVLLATSFFKGGYPSIIQCLWLISRDGFVSHLCIVPHAAAVPPVSLRGGYWMLQLCISDVASGMHSFCHDPHLPALGDAGWRILILFGNKNHVLFRL